MQTILYPLVSEKSMQQGGKGRFTFKVTGDSDKATIKKTVETNFKVNVVGISTMWVKGKVKRTGARREKKVLTAWKKAVVTLKPGQKIDIFDTV